MNLLGGKFIFLHRCNVHTESFIISHTNKSTWLIIMHNGICSTAVLCIFREEQWEFVFGITGCQTDGLLDQWAIFWTIGLSD